jgi:ABC-2 type transport system permease protein
MTSNALGQPAQPALAPVPVLRRIYGLGSIFAKTIRDSRRASLATGLVLGILMITVAKAIVTEFATPASRVQLEHVIQAVPPILAGMAGRVVNVDTLGGYLQYKYGTFFPLIASLWSILALSGTLAAEARRGSLEFVAAGPITRRRIALQKLAGHVTMLGIASFLIFVSILITGTFATLPGDELPISAALGYSVWLMLLALAAGSIAFALGPFVGRGAAAGIAGAVTFAGFIVNGYQAAIPQLAPFANLSWFGWTVNHIPLAGVYDWASLVLVAVFVVALLTIGVEAFNRRDIGVTSTIPTPSLPHALVGVRGPVSRLFGHNLPSALAWGIGIGFFGFVIAGSGSDFVRELQKSPDFMNLLQTAFPNADVASVGGFLQLLFIEFGLILAGLAAATLVAGWASDETSGRLEFLLATPLSRDRWTIGGGFALLGSIAVVTVLLMGGIAFGSAIVGGDIVTPTIGSATLGLFAIAMAGVGIAVGGVFGTGFAAPTVAIVTIVIWLADVIVPALNLPDVVHELALTAHYGAPMLGQWDLVGVVASLALGIGGVIVGTWGFQRRDLRG